MRATCNTREISGAAEIKMAVSKQLVLSNATFLKGDVLTVLKKLPPRKCDLIITSPPYNIGKIYERSEGLSFEKYIEWLDSVVHGLVNSLAEHGSICWQVGSFIKDGEVFPLDIHTYNSFKSRGMQLRNRIVWSQDSIARRIVNSLNEKGPLSDEFERYFYDKGKIKTTSIVSYGLKQLIKLSGDDSLFKVWKHADKAALIDKPTDSLALDYITFCATEINTFIGAVKSSVPAERWTADSKIKGRMLTTTILNGFIICLRLIVEKKKKLYSFDTYKSKFETSDLSKFGFASYKSSQYRSLGEALYDKYFA
jgi:hypothetical protein